MSVRSVEQYRNFNEKFTWLLKLQSMKIPFSCWPSSVSLSPTAGHTGLLYAAHLALLIFLSGCSRSGLYSVIVTNPGVQHEQSFTNDLPEPYHRKEVVSPEIIQRTEESAMSQWNETLRALEVHHVDTTVKIDLLSTPASAKVIASACGNEGIAILVHDASRVRSGGKFIDVQLRYVCVDPDDTVDVWAGTEFYKIVALECSEGFHTLELQFFAPRVLKDRKDPTLMRVIAVCADP